MINGTKRQLTRVVSKVFSKILNRILPNDFYFSQNGYCPCCQKSTQFLSYHPWLRDNFVCVNCGSIPRNRALLRVLDTYFPDWRALAVHESSPSIGGASERLRSDCKQYVSSQYYPQHPLGHFVEGHRNENLEAQTFPDCSFDLVISQDVLEHVYDPASVFREIARTLKPGGAHVFAVPLVNKHNPTQVWATKNDDGSPNFLQHPEYHGNPIDPNGSPVTMHWGYDIIDKIAEATGLPAKIEYIDDLQFGIRAEYIEIVIAQKPFERAGRGSDLL